MMKKSIVLFVIVLVALLLIISVAGCQQKTQSLSSATGNIRMTATINGLEKGEEATLTISHEGSAASEELFFTRDVRSDGKKTITVDIAANLEDGYYQLLLEAPDKYFREPKGYFFMVSQSQIVNPTGMKVIFNLLPQPEGLVAEAYRGLSAPPKAPPPPGPLFIVVTLPHEARYLPGEPVELQLVFTNVSKDPLTLEYVPAMHVTKHLISGQVLYSQIGTEQKVETKPDEKIITEFTWDQKDLAGEQVPPGWYDVNWKAPGTDNAIDRTIGLGSQAMVLIQYSQGVMEKTIEVNESRTVNDITITLERIVLTTKGMMIYVRGTLPYIPPPSKNSSMESIAEYSVDGGEVIPLHKNGSLYRENGSEFHWGGTHPGMLDPVPSDAKELVFRIKNIFMTHAPDDIVKGPFEFKIPLE
jgi:hypothetical protein